MIKPEQVPKEALFAFGEELYMKSSTDAEAIAAALNAWSGMWTHDIMGKKMCGLPLFNGNKNE